MSKDVLRRNSTASKVCWEWAEWRPGMWSKQLPIAERFGASALAVVRYDRFFQSLIRERSWEMFAAIMFDDYCTSFDFSAKYSNAMIRWQRAGVHSTYTRTISHGHRYLFRIVFSYSWLLASRDQQLMMHNWSAPTMLNDAHRC